ncbi:MAG: hypothetical protein N3A54_03020 [Patescibacteria group bacterium]|nr:hypothetical protein [Patescibacteria group bacterium]
MPYKLSSQAIASFILILQKGILEQEDVTQLFRGLELTANEQNELLVSNVPTGINIDKIQKKIKERLENHEEEEEN